MVELVFTPTSAYRSSPEGAQAPKNGTYTHLPWALIILRAASVQSICAVHPGQHTCPGPTGGSQTSSVCIRAHCLLRHLTELLG